MVQPSPEPEPEPEPSLRPRPRRKLNLSLILSLTITLNPYVDPGSFNNPKTYEGEVGQGGCTSEEAAAFKKDSMCMCHGCMPQPHGSSAWQFTNTCLKVKLHYAILPRTLTPLSSEGAVSGYGRGQSLAAFVRLEVSRAYAQAFARVLPAAATVQGSGASDEAGAGSRGRCNGQGESGRGAHAERTDCAAQGPEVPLRVLLPAMPLRPLFVCSCL